MTAAWRLGPPDRPTSPLAIGVVVAVVVIDQLAKAAAATWLPQQQPVDVIPGLLTLYRVANTGIAFSLFAGSGLLLTIVTALIAVGVVVYWLRAEDGGRMAAIAYALILGGAIGNLIDRLRLGSVVDFLFLHLGARPLFIFNLADAALTIGPVLLVLQYALPPRD